MLLTVKVSKNNTSFASLSVILSQPDPSNITLGTANVTQVSKSEGLALYLLELNDYCDGDKNPVLFTILDDQRQPMVTKSPLTKHEILLPEEAELVEIEIYDFYGAVQT